MKQTKNPDLEETGKKLKKLRKQAGLTQEQLAEKVGGTCTNTVISRYERGIVEMGIQTMYDIAEALKVTPEQLMPERLIHRLGNACSGSLDPPCAYQPPALQHLPDDEFNELLSQLDSENKEKVREYMKMLLFCQQHTTQTA